MQNHRAKRVGSTDFHACCTKWCCFILSRTSLDVFFSSLWVFSLKHTHTKKKSTTPWGNPGTNGREYLAFCKNLDDTCQWTLHLQTGEADTIKTTVSRICWRCPNNKNMFFPPLKSFSEGKDEMSCLKQSNFCSPQEIWSSYILWHRSGFSWPRHPFRCLLRLVMVATSWDITLESWIKSFVVYKHLPSKTLKHIAIQQQFNTISWLFVLSQFTLCHQAPKNQPVPPLAR